MDRSTRRRIAVAAGTAVALVVAAAAWTLWPRGTSEVTAQEALRDYRARARTTPTSATANDDRAGAVPGAGVYTYRAKGDEEVKLGPLPSEARRLPATVTAVVVDLGDGCFELTVNLFAEHTEDTHYCTSGGRLTLAAHTKHQRIGALAPTATMACDPGVLRGPDAATGHRLACRLDLDGGPAAISASLVGAAEQGASEVRAVGGREVEVTPVTVTYEISGGLSGTWTETLWLTEANLPVHIERRLSITGPATFTEHSDLELAGLTPTT